MPVAGPFYLAWVDPTETTFNSEHYRMDEYVFSARRTLSEGQKPLLEIEIENPGVGLLSTGRKLWAWFAWDNGTAIVPLFFGRVLGAPVAINKETLVVQLVANPADYKQRVQMAAEALKDLPYYDPVFISVGERDNPDTILETRASFWDIDPITLAVSAVSIIEGPDGTVNVTDHFYDSLDNTVSQPPATAILMDASVSWTQAYKGVLPDPLSASIFSYGGDAIISDWPRPNAQLGGGWQVFDSAATPSAGMNPEMVTDGFTWQNTALHHEDGDTMSVSYSTTFPLGAGEGFVTSYTQQTGFADPFHIDDDGDVSPINIPASFQAQLAWPISGTVGSMLSLKYTAARTRTERVKFLVRADMQEVIVDPTVDQDSEVMTLSGADVSMPLINMRNWSSIAGTFVPLGSVIFPDNPDLPGSQTAQIATHEGTAGTVEPGFSDVPGVTTADGSGLVWVQPRAGIAARELARLAGRHQHSNRHHHLAEAARLHNDGPAPSPRPRDGAEGARPQRVRGPDHLVPGWALQDLHLGRHAQRRNVLRSRHHAPERQHVSGCHSGRAHGCAVPHPPVQRHSQRPPRQTTRSSGRASMLATCQSGVRRGWCLPPATSPPTAACRASCTLRSACARGCCGVGVAPMYRSMLTTRRV
jgi:hypothetical protein